MQGCPLRSWQCLVHLLFYQSQNEVVFDNLTESRAKRYESGKRRMHPIFLVFISDHLHRMMMVLLAPKPQNLNKS